MNERQSFEVRGAKDTLTQTRTHTKIERALVRGPEGEGKGEGYKSELQEGEQMFN